MEMIAVIFAFMATTVSGIFRGENPFILNGETYSLEYASDPQTEEYLVWIQNESKVQVTCYDTLVDFLDDWDILLRTLKYDHQSDN
jgi:hypothetical protein